MNPEVGASLIHVLLFCHLSSCMEAKAEMRRRLCKPISRFLEGCGMKSRFRGRDCSDSGTRDCEDPLEFHGRGELKKNT